MATKDSFIFVFRTLELKTTIICDKSFNEKQYNFTFFRDTLDVLQLYAKQYSLNAHIVLTLNVFLFCSYWKHVLLIPLLLFLVLKRK